jgi:hypothetical protein
VPAAAVGPDLPHSLAHDLEPSLQRPWRGPRARGAPPPPPPRARRRGGGAAAAAARARRGLPAAARAGLTISQQKD